MQYPVARGTIHIKSADPAEHPTVDPNYLNHPADVAVMAAGLKFAEKLVGTPALEGKMGKRVHPPPERFPSRALRSAVSPLRSTASASTTHAAPAP